MGRVITLDQYLNSIAEKALDNSRQLKRDVHQRRNGMEDLYGVCFSAHANELSSDDNRYHAKFYISLSPDYVYLHRFAFKFVIMPSIIEGEDPSEGRDWRVEIGGQDITDYLKEQQDIDPSDPLFEGKGIYPSNGLTDTVENFYDILDVISVMIAEGQDPDDSESAVYQLLKPNFKPVEISSVKPFSVDAYFYAKYSVVNR